MREIKFRAWTGEKFVDEDYFYVRYGKVYTITEFDGLKDKKWIPQQYTGLKDFNKKEIYEGDVFEGSTYKWEAVEFKDGRFQANLMGARVYSLEELCCDMDHMPPTVIGNIFENPELLK